MQSDTSRDRPFLISAQMGGHLRASAEFLDRPPRVFVDASCAPATFPPPDQPCSIRLPDWLSAAQTQTRPGGSQLAGGGTIIFEDIEIESFAAELRSIPLPLLEKSGTQPKDEQRVILWSRADHRSTLRAVTTGGVSQTKGSKRVSDEIEAAGEPAFAIGFEASRKLPQHSEALPENAACPLEVWSLWRNPQYQ